jgi:hypothetical protein
MNNRKEAEIQSEFFRVFPLLFPSIPNKLLFAVPNGGSRNVKEAANLKRQGVKSGVADVLLLVPSKQYAFLCLEFKTDKGKQSEHQEEFERQVNSVFGKYVVVRSVEEAVMEVTEYLNKKGYGRTV